MSGLVSVVYGRRALDGTVLNAIDEVLAGASKSLQRTRKGRVWDCSIGDRIIHVAVEYTLHVLFDCEDDLLKLGLLPNDAPFRVLFGTPCHAAEDGAIIDSLVPKICRVIDGVPAPIES